MSTTDDKTRAALDVLASELAAIRRELDDLGPGDEQRRLIVRAQMESVEAKVRVLRWGQGEGYMRTVKSRCPICDGVIDSVPIKYGVKAMIACPGCATFLAVGVEHVPPNDCDISGNDPPKTEVMRWRQGERA